ncbi:MAG: threonine/serine exporter ThrE family protein [Betaproteobacteria bacterium]
MSDAAPATPVDPVELLEFTRKLGQAYLACGEQTAEVEALLRKMARAYGMRDARVVAFPTGVFISVHDGTTEHTTLTDALTRPLRLDQVGAIYALGGQAADGAIALRAGIDELAEILLRKERFGRLGQIVGHTVMAAGVGMLLQPTWENIAIAAVLGLVVGLVKALLPGRTVVALPMPVFVAALVSVLVFYAQSYGLPVEPIHALIPPLLTYLPGGTLTLGMVELAYGDMVSGASRLMTGLVQLVLLAFGLAAGAALMGAKPDDLVKAAYAVGAAPWAPWLGVLIFGLGVYLHFSAPRDSLPWMLLVLLAASGTQRLAAGAFGGEISGFFGMLVATPLAYLIQTRLSGPPAMVTFLPSFWVVVPGALGLLSVTRMLSDRTAGIEGLTTVLFVVASVALGTLVGASLFRLVTAEVGRMVRRARRLRWLREHRDE